MKKTFLLICALMPVLLNAQLPINKYNSYLTSHNQVVFVTAPDWNAIQGLMQLYQRASDHDAWKLVTQFAVTVGRNGMAVDRQSILPKPVSAIVKRKVMENHRQEYLALGLFSVIII